MHVITYRFSQDSVTGSVGIWLDLSPSIASLSLMFPLASKSENSILLD